MKTAKKVSSLLTAGAITMSLVPMPMLTASASSGDGGQYVPVYVNGCMVVNGGVTSSEPSGTIGEKTDDGNRYAPDPNSSFSLGGNSSQMSGDVSSYNMFRCFGSGIGNEAVPIAGFSYSGGDDEFRIINSGGENEEDNDGTYSITLGYNGDDDDDEDGTYDYYINLDNNPVLKVLASSGQLEFFVSGLVVSGHQAHLGDDDHCRCQVWVYRNGSQVGYGDGGTRTQSNHLGVLNTGWQSLPASGGQIHIKVSFEEVNGGTGDKLGLCEGLLLFRDNRSPSATYSTSNNATVNSDKREELLLKLGTKNYDDPSTRYYAVNDYNGNGPESNAAKQSMNYIDMQLNFDEPVSAANLGTDGNMQGINNAEYSDMVNHRLFSNTAGTGYINQGATRTLDLYKGVDSAGTTYVTNAYSYTGGTGCGDAYSLLGRLVKSLTWRYTAKYGDFSGNTAIPNGGCIENGDSSQASLMAKINSAGFHDAAGNPLSSVGGGTGKNIFDKNDGGYNVIVDAVPPTYSRVGNGITPDILTQTVLNENDSVDFIVAFSEAAITKRGWDNSKTYLMLDNGDKAYFKSKSSNGKQWIFSYKFKSGTETDASLLKVIALGNDALDGSLREAAGWQSKPNYSVYTYNVDGRTITDYVGNVMSDRANEDSSTNTSQIESSISWAGIAVDNVKPDITFDYSVYGTGSLKKATGSEWGQAAKVLASATDPDVPVAKYDPDYSASNKERPSKGIYRPDSTTGSTASAVGLIFYVWTRDIEPPSTGENFEAVKRYSLTGVQPKQVTEKAYSDEWANMPYSLMMANNFSDIVPPDAAMSSDGSGDGPWYLHVWTADMTWDTARQLMQYKKAQSLQYKDGYDNAAYLALKQRRTEETAIGSGSTEPDYNAAWESVREEVYRTAYTDRFLAWLGDSGQDFYSDAAMVYARSQALMTLAKYDDTSVWPLSDYAQADSNWTVQTARLLLDNTAPSADAVYMENNKIGDGTAAVEMPFTVSDELSGIDVDNVYYQWVKKNNDGSQTYDEGQWMQAALDSKEVMDNALTDGLTAPDYGAKSATFTAKTLGNVSLDGEYVLYLRYDDTAGNRTITNSGDATVTVNTAMAIGCAFGPEQSISMYMNAVSPEVTVSGINVGRLEYMVTNSIERPASGYASAEPEETDTENKIYKYTLPAINDEENTRSDGTWYVHVLIYENADQTAEPHYYRQAYLLDRTAPEVFINPDGFDSQQDSVEAVVSITDNLSGVGADAKYRISDSAEPLASVTEGWIALPESGRVTISAAAAGDYYLHVLTSDQTGTVTEKISGAFALRGTKAPSTLPHYGWRFMNLYQENGVRYAIANIDIDVNDKTGYRYSVSTDGGNTWCNWLPYMSMVKMELPEKYDNGEIKVKFRAPDGAVGDPADIDTGVFANEIWATAQFDSTLKRQSGKELTFLMSLAEGVEINEKISSGETSRTNKTDNGNITVTENGVYEFELSRDGKKSSSDFVVVVDIFDDTSPEGYVSYSDITPTNGNVIATVKSDEAMYVKSLKVTYDGEDETVKTPQANFSFAKNGTAEFVIADEAQNEATVTATVSNIDKTAPEVRISTSYDTYKTVGSGNGLIASGVTLNVEKTDPSGENFIVVGDDRSTSVEVTKNGEYSFLVQDMAGNAAKASVVIDNIVSSLPDCNVESTYVSDDPEVNGAPEDTVQPKQGKIKAAITFDKINDGRKLFLGSSQISEERKVTVWDENTNSGKTETRLVTNELEKNSDGNYIYERTYIANGESVIVVCDDLGNVSRIPINVTGLDNNAPTLTLNKPTAVISNDQTKRLPEMTDEEISELFGGYTVTDNAYSDGFTITVSRSDDGVKTDENKGRLDQVGRFTLVYSAADPAGNVSYAEQTLIVIPSDGLLVEAGRGDDFSLLSELSTNSSILPDNHVTFRIDKARMQTMFYGANKEKVENNKMRYDILYVRGLYREGQLKTIASQLTSEELESRSFDVTFPEPGWYTIIIRNQERTKEYTTFFIAQTSE